MKVTVCEDGVTFCPANKECYIPKHSKARQGVCRCVKGYEEDNLGDCVEMVDLGSSDINKWFDVQSTTLEPREATELIKEPRESTTLSNVAEVTTVKVKPTPAKSKY